MSKKMDIYTELDDFVEENEGQVTLTDVAKHFAEYGFQYAKKMIEDYLLCVELSNFFPTLGDEDADNGKEALTKSIKEFLEEM